jgi:hypothetical protein
MHDLTAARKNARTDEDAAAIAWAQDEIERLRARNGDLSDTLTRMIEDMKQVMRNSTAQLVEIERIRSQIKSAR